MGILPFTRWVQAATWRARAAPDPLQTSRLACSPLPGIRPTRELRELGKLAATQGARVPKAVQDGPTCGLYALKMILDRYAAVDESCLNPLVFTRDESRPSSHSLPHNTRGQFLYDLALREGLSARGEMYAEPVADLAQLLGYRAEVRDLSPDALEDCLGRRHPAWICIDVDVIGDPGAAGGKRAHAAVVQGRFVHDSQGVLVATHAWDGADRLWSEPSTLASSEQILPANLVSPPPAEPNATLAGRLVEIWPTGHAI